MLCRLLLTSSLLAGGLFAQSGRTLAITAPPRLGTTLTITITHPPAAAGQYYEALFSLPNAAVVDLGLPFVVGSFRLDLVTFQTFVNGVLGATGATPISVPVPNDISLLGGGFDLQTIDVDLTGPTLYLSDDDVEIRPFRGIEKVQLCAATNSSPVTGDYDVQTVDDATIGAPVSQGLGRFVYQSIQPRGQEGFVEGFGGSFTGIAHNSDIACWTDARVAKRTANPAYQVMSLPNGHDIGLVRRASNTRLFSVLSFRRATGLATIVPGSTVTDTGPLNEPACNLLPRVAFSRDAAWGAVIVRDTNPAVADRVLAFRTDGSAPAVDITATTQASMRFFDGSALFTTDFLLVAGSGGWYWTSASSPGVLAPLAVPNTTASNAPNAWVYPSSWRVARDGATAWFPIGSGPTERGEMDIVRVSANAGVPQVTNVTRFAAPTRIAEFGYSGVTPSAALDSSFGIKASLSTDGTRLAFLGMGTSLGLYVADGTANPAPTTVAGAAFYSEVAFLDATRVVFCAGATPELQDMYALDTTSSAVTAMTTAGNVKTRGQFRSANGNWWYFVRSNAAGSVNDFVGIDTTATTLALKDITGSEFSSGSAHSLRTGGLNGTTDPWPALEFQLRRVPLSGHAVFTARRAIAGPALEDANVFRFDMDHGGEAVEITQNRATGTQDQVLHIDSLVAAPDPLFVAWAQRRGLGSTRSEDVFVAPLLGGLVRQSSVSNPTGQTIVDGSIRFVGLPVNGLVWARGTGPLVVPDANTMIEWSPLGGPYTPTPLLAPAASGRVLQVIGTNQ